MTNTIAEEGRAASSSPGGGSHDAIDQIDPFAPSTLSCPHPFWAVLRRDAPVFPVVLPGTSALSFMVTRADTIERVVLDTDTFSNHRDPNVWRWPVQPPELTRILTEGGGCPFASTWSTTDPPLYHRYRKVANDTLSPRKSEMWRSEVEQLADGLIAQMPESGIVDWVESYSKPMPMAVIRTILGLSPEDDALLIASSRAFMKMMDPATPDEHRPQAMRSMLEAQKKLIPLVHQYREEPVENFLSDIANARHPEGHLMSMGEVLSMGFIAVVGGNETTANGLNTAAYYLSGNGEVQAQLRNDRSLVARFVEEVLRLQSPTSMQPRVAKRDVELDGVAIPKGATLLMCWGAANRDEEWFSDADEIRLDRENPRRHLAFGKGLHMCAGMHLARIEIETSINRWLDAFSSMELAASPEDELYAPVVMIRSILSLPISIKR